MMEIYLQKTFIPGPASVGALLALALVVFMPKTAAAEADLNRGKYQIYQSIKDVEIVDNVSCLPQKTLEVHILQNMQLSQNRAFTAGATNQPHIRWIIGGLPDAQGEVRSIGPAGKAYSASPFWRHPIEVRVQLIADSVVVIELGRKAKSLCDPSSPRLGTIIRKLTKKLFQSHEILGEN